METPYCIGVESDYQYVIYDRKRIYGVGRTQELAYYNAGRKMNLNKEGNWVYCGRITPSLLETYLTLGVETRFYPISTRGKDGKLEVILVDLKEFRQYLENLEKTLNGWWCYWCILRSDLVIVSTGPTVYTTVMRARWGNGETFDDVWFNLNHGGNMRLVPMNKEQYEILNELVNEIEWNDCVEDIQYTQSEGKKLKDERKVEEERRIEKTQ